MSRYFSGQGFDLGTVTPLAVSTFVELCALLQEPVVLEMTREEFHELDKKERDKVKRVAYLTPATFKADHRNYENAGVSNLIALDVDDATEASRLIQPGAFDAISHLGFIAWHTASSTAEAPRLRILVSAEAIPLTHYRDAAQTIGKYLGLERVTTESRVAVQPMFFPTVFSDSGGNPIIASNPEGIAFEVEKVELVDQVIPAPEALGEEPIAELTNYRAPLDEVTVEGVKEALVHLDPDMPMHGWIEIAASLKHQFGEEGYVIWDEWSAKGKKYVDADETAYRWSTLKSQPVDRIPVTIRSLFKWAKEKGWDNTAATKKQYDEVLAWINSEMRSSEELFDLAPQKIAKLEPMIGTLEKEMLLQALQKILKARGMIMPMTGIRQAVKTAAHEGVKPNPILPWIRGLCYVTAINKFYRSSVARKFSPEVLDLMYGPIDVGDETPMRPRDYATRVGIVPQVENLLYDPANGSQRVFTSGGIPYVNTYRPGEAISDASRADEGEDLIRRHLAHLIKETDYQRIIVDFLAYHFQHPGKKINWAPLIQSTKGTGKSFLGVMMHRLLGSGNVKAVSNANIMEGTHNEWAYGCQLAFLEEVRVVGQNRHAVMDKLKPCITDDFISLRAMMEGPRTVPNIQNYFLSTNHHDALAIQDDERRYFVISSPLQHPSQIEAMGGEAYFNRLFGHVEENAGGIKYWLENWKISKDFNPRGRAPVTKYLKELAMNAASPLMAAVMQALDDESHPLVRRDLVSVTALREAMDLTQVTGFSDQSLGGVLRELGWSKFGRVTLQESRHALWVKGNMQDPVQRAKDRLEVL